MEAAKRALQLFLHSLPEGSLFNIVSFGSRHKALFPGAQGLGARVRTCMQSQRFGA